ncbi:DNA-directed RNA polymerases II 24 kDa polypeptide (RNA polymerase II subunit 5) [Tritrichomonas musculus]|uniref:DNA-directed RNA polymerases II 24 kDa polypeptide (RNA polymerase II subunit 5) n=1 Tax=Tritrichomonas musculus TaxID=1915356 RepID=A0ABR2KQC7_9EUKA
MDGNYDENELNRYFRMYKTIIQMLHDRKFRLDEDKQNIYDEEVNFEIFRTLYDNFRPSELNCYCESLNPEVPGVKVLFDIQDSKINQKVIQAIVAQMKAENIKHVIIIVKDGSIPAPMIRLIDKLRNEKQYKIEYFEQKEVLINITKHDLVPTHEPLTTAEKNELLQRYDINESQLPKILKMDPVVRYFGVEPGTVMKITRRSETAGRYVTYRLVC